MNEDYELWILSNNAEVLFPLYIFRLLNSKNRTFYIKF